MKEFSEFENPEKKEKLIENGQKSIFKFSWNKAYNEFKQVILN